MSEFKVGDRVQVINFCSGAYAGHIYTLGMDGGSLITLLPSYESGGCKCTNNWILLANQNNKVSLNIKDSFTLAFKAEPEKSFRKTGITNGDDFLTEDGQKIFLSWLLKKYGADFKTEVVDGLLSDMKEDNK